MKILENDSWLKPYEKQLAQREKLFLRKEKALTQGGSLSDFATGYLYFGLHRTATSWVFREWAPNATAIYMIGEFTDWKTNAEYALKPLSKGVWEIELPADKLRHQHLYRLLVCWKGGQGERIPSYANRTVQDDYTKIFSAQVWNPEHQYVWTAPKCETKNTVPLIYESHAGMATEEYRVGTFTEFRDIMLPYINESGYNTIQLMAVQEHPYYGSFGYHVSNFFAVSSRFGTPDEFKSLIDTAHQMGLRVIMDLVHSHSVKSLCKP